MEYTNPLNINMESIDIFEENQDNESSDSDEEDNENDNKSSDEEEDSDDDDDDDDDDKEKAKKPPIIKDSEDEIDRPYEQRSVCKPQHDWQTMSFPTCNTIHEQSMMQQLLQRLVVPQNTTTANVNQNNKNNIPRGPKRFYLGEGVTRIVWLLERLDFRTTTTATDTNSNNYYGDELLALKTHHIHKEWSPDNFDRNRIDALVSERLTKSSHTLNVYGFCGNSALYQIANGGTLYDAISTNREYGPESASEDELKDYDQEKGLSVVNNAPWDHWNNPRKMEVAIQVVGAVADLHSIDSNQYASVAHCDLDLTQFVSIDDGKSFQLNDFNGGRLIYWDTQYNKTCTFKSGMYGGRFRAPEEVLEEYEYPATAAIDVYALGTALYEILTGKEPFETISRKTARQLFAEGQRPYLPKKYANSNDPNIQGIIKAMESCWTNDFQQRPTARRIEEILLKYQNASRIQQ